MKHLLKPFICTTVLLAFTCQGFSQKTYTNTEWVNQTPAVGDGIYHSSSIVVANKLVVTSKVLNVSGNTDIATIKYNNSGDTLWMATFNGSADLDDYGVDLAATTSGDIVVAGAAQNTGGGFDYTILRYNGSTGSLQWSYTWNGVASEDDIPTDIMVDGSDNIYVTGGSLNAAEMADYATIKLSSSGSYQWLNTYDYASLHDAASKIELIGGKVVVSGASVSAVGVWDIATLKLNVSTGSIMNTYRTTGGASIVEVHGIASDISNNIYLTGYAESGGVKNVQTIKLDSDLNLLWTADYAGAMDDIGFDIDVDGSGNVYVVGSTQISASKTKALLIKYDASGSVDWEKEYGDIHTSNGAIAKKMVVLPSGDFYVTGSLLDFSGNDAYFCNKYNSAGTFICTSTYASAGIDNQAYDIKVDGDDVYITGLSNGGGSNQTTVVKYTVAERDFPAVVVGGKNSHVNDEIVIRFHRDHILASAVNNDQKNYGSLSEFVTPATITALATAYSNYDWSTARTYKIFNGLHTTDSLSISRTGTEVEVDPFWATLVVEVTDKDESAIAQLLDTAVFPHVQHASVNSLYELDSDDPLFLFQHSLTSATYTDGHINIDPAWTLETGEDHIRVGVYDTGIRYSHDDLGSEVDPVDGKIRGGKDYVTGGDLESIDNNGDFNGHGTKVAGVIGAFRNNDHGVAGIAGGNWPYDPGAEPGAPLPSENKGVSMYGFRIAVSASELLPESEISAALIEGAANISGDYGYALDIQNCSFGKIFDITEDEWNLIFDAQSFVFRNGCVLVASKGNQGWEVQRMPSYSLKGFWTMAIGGSATDGSRYEDSNYGNDVDVIAPYDPLMIRSTWATGDDQYGEFAGTSSAAPHVAGVAALMMSHINAIPDLSSNLAPDDVEHLINEFAVDQYTGEAELWWDKYTGHGLLDAGTVLDNIDKSEWLIRHYYDNFVLDLEADHIKETEPITIFFEDEDHEPGMYSGDKYWIESDHPHTLNPGDVIYDIWALQSYTNLCMFNPSYSDRSKLEQEMKVNSMTPTYARLWGETIHFTSDPDGNPVDFWYPVAPGEEVKLGYSLRILTDFVGIEEEEESMSELTCYPNPTESTTTLVFTLAEEEQVSGEIIDLQGRIVQTITTGELPVGQNQIVIDLGELPKGIYMVRLNYNDEDHFEKIIKH